MLSDLQIEALAQGCGNCGGSLKAGNRVLAVYHASTVRSFAQQVELGVIGASARNFWVHLWCEDPKLEKGWHMHPDIHHCIRCSDPLHKQDVVVPVFQVVDPEAVNPADSTDKGIALGDRVYFVHVDCKNGRLDKKGTSILHT
jgi:hypothetical protein